MPTPECPVCTSDAADPSFTKDGYSHYHCRECDALYLHPVPSKNELSDYYVAQEETTRSSQCWERDEQDYRHYEPIWDDALREIERGAGRGPLLDVGCGGGQFLAFARRRGWKDLTGIEYAPGAAARAREQSGATVHSVDFVASQLASGHYAGITMWNVIEHAPNPRAFIDEVERLLRPSGVYVADCPNRRGVTMRVIGKDAYVVMPPEHLTYFSHRSLRRLLEGGGLKVSSLKSNTIYINDWVRFLTKPRAEEEAREAHLSWYSRITSSAGFMRLIGVANVVLNGLRLGDQMLVAARKRADGDT
ncbi:MAG: SAM-dependent methyltransferase [Myxococcota bacterium]|jgi:SAM-dependent methyltransferase